MLFDRDRKIRVALTLADGLLAALSMGLAAAVWASEPLQRWVTSAAVPSLDQAGHTVALAAVIAPFALHRCGAHAVPLGGSFSAVIRHLLRGTLLSVALLVAAGLAFGTPGLSAGVVGLYAGIQFAALTADRLARRSLRRNLKGPGRDGARFVVVGTGPRAQKLADSISRKSDWRLLNLGFMDDNPRERDVEALGDMYLGKTKEIERLISLEVIDEVFVALPRRNLCEESVAEMVDVCESVGVNVTIANDLFPTRRAKPRVHQLLDFPAMTLSNYPHRSLWALAVKRSIDIVVASVGLMLLLPLGVLLALAIKLESPGPIFFVQRRCTLRGRTFPFIKFRTMYADAEERLEELRHLNEASGPVFKIKNDPRITPLGRVLRKYSIDELPQLLSVLVGHMSLVGPRPPIPSEVDRYHLAQRRRLSVRPGITCLWQVSGRSLIQFDEWVELDLEYIDRWSLWLDLQILLRTIPAVLTARGAS
jgi:exopolysaccharide biosynthesis polyprenyl glycosylphosphotransferase